jgi:hypothetical protein
MAAIVQTAMITSSQSGALISAMPKMGSTPLGASTGRSAEINVALRRGGADVTKKLSRRKFQSGI